MSKTNALNKTGWVDSLWIYGAAGLLLFLITDQLIPVVHRWTSLSTLLLWFLMGGIGVFIPLIAFGCELLRRERQSSQSWRSLHDRLRLRALTRSDWCWTIGGLLTVVLLTVASRAVLSKVLGITSFHPSFLDMDSSGLDRHLILTAWIPFWIDNILGEEFLWRAVLLPRQEAALGGRAWLVNSAGWLIFHFAFGWQLLVLLLPIIFILPYIAQRTRNTWPAVIIHAGLNGPAFVAVALGLT